MPGKQVRSEKASLVKVPVGAVSSALNVSRATSKRSILRESQACHFSGFRPEIIGFFIALPAHYVHYRKPYDISAKIELQAPVSLISNHASSVG